MFCVSFILMVDKKIVTLHHYEKKNIFANPLYNSNADNVSTRKDGQRNPYHPRQGPGRQL